MSPDAYCEARVAARGSSLYYAILDLPPAQRLAWMALAAFAQEIEATRRASNEAEVVGARLDWWSREVAAGGHTAGHPVAQVLAAAGLAGAGELQVWIAGARADLRQTRFLDRAGLLAHYAERDLAFATLAARCLELDAAARPVLAPLARSLRLVGLIASTGARLRQDEVWLPVADLQATGVSIAQLRRNEYGPAWLALMSAQARWAREAWAESIEAAGKPLARRLRPFFVLGAIAQRQLGEIESEGFAVLHQRIELTPMSRFWTAWRTRVLGARPV